MSSHSESSRARFYGIRSGQRKANVAAGLTVDGRPRQRTFYERGAKAREREWDRLAERNAYEAFDYWFKYRATDEQIAAWYAALGRPWSNPRLSGGDQYALRYRLDPQFQLKERLRRQLKKKGSMAPHLPESVRYALHTGGDSSTIEALLGYSMTQLRTHLERQFTRGMSWQAYGKDGWHIDHILPKKCFNLKTLEGVRAYWSLSNLRPLSAERNLAKGARIESLL